METGRFVSLFCSCFVSLFSLANFVLFLVLRLLGLWKWVGFFLFYSFFVFLFSFTNSFLFCLILIFGPFSLGNFDLSLWVIWTCLLGNLDLSLWVTSAFLFG